MEPITIAACSGAMLGLLLGSFCNVCISRLPDDRSIVSPPSHCEACGKHLRWFHNIPIVSYVLLRGRCSGCGAPISVRHLLVEAVTAVWFAVAAAPFATAPPLWSDAFFRLLIHQTAIGALGFFLLALMVIDWRWQRLPDALTIPGISAGLLLVCADAMFLGDNDYNLVLHRRVRLNAAGSGHSTGNIFMTGPEHLVYGRLLAVVGCFLLLYLVRTAYRKVRGRDGMGLGDAKLLATIAALLGLAPALLSLFVGTLMATAYALWLLLRKRATAITRLPFGSFLAAGGMLAALSGAAVVNWYLGLFR